MHDIVRSLTFEVDWPQQGDGVALGSELSEFAQHELLSELQRVLETCSPEQVVYIDRLDVQLQASSQADWRSAMVDNLGRELAPLLRRELEEATASPREGHALGSTTSRSPIADFAAVLGHYLESGGVPWYFSGGRGDLERRAEHWVQVSSRGELWTLLSRWGRSKNAQRRMIRLLSTRALARLLDALLGVTEALLSRWHSDLEQLVQWLREQQNSDMARCSAALNRAREHRLPESLLSALLDEALGAPDSTSLVASETSFADARSRGLGVFVTELFAAAGFGRPGPSLPVRNAEGRLATTSDSSRQPDVISAEFRGALRTLAQSTESDMQQCTVAPSGTSNAGQSGSGRPPQVDSGLTVHRASREGQFITDAGLILLGPYLRLFLGRLGIAQGDHIVDMAGALVAVQHLVTGHTQSPAEYELALTKLLCGFPLFEVPPLLPQVDTRTQREADDLLGSVIEHWSALKNTSVSGLREAFLQRPGKLELSRSGNWLLRVEQRPYDMLLGYLPWGFQLIKLPWMERVITTEWVH